MNKYSIRSWATRIQIQRQSVNNTYHGYLETEKLETDIRCKTIEKN